MGRSLIYTCDNPACCEMCEDPTEWWRVQVEKGLSQLWSSGDIREVLWFCSDVCLSDASFRANKVEPSTDT